MQAPHSLKRERAILVGICGRRDERPEVEEHLEELGRLAETAGAEVVGVVLQDRGPVRPSTLVRQGKLDELVALAQEHAANLALFDEDLSPAQVKNLEEATEVRVLDRSALILDIFARRARSREARTQVELAQLRYLLPRLTRRWGHLSRQEGGIGQRGVGETQLEIDRRLVRRRIARLAGDLKAIEKEREERRKRRFTERRVALVGYTNAGKSTLMNLLTGAETLVEDRLFATLDPLVRRCALGGPPFLVADTVGFIRKLPHHLVASFRSTLEEAGDADLLVEVVDAASPALEDQRRRVQATLEDLHLEARPRLVVFNKVDAAHPGDLERLRAANPEAAFLSALDPTNAAPLAERIRAGLGEPLVEQTLLIPAGQAHRMSRFASTVQVLRSAWLDGHVEVRLRGRKQDLFALALETGATPTAGEGIAEDASRGHA